MNEAIPAMNELLTKCLNLKRPLNQLRENIRKSIETDRITQDGILFNYLAAQRKGLNYDIRKNTFETVGKINFTDLNNFS
jgi:hypothetical protein